MTDLRAPKRRLPILLGSMALLLAAPVRAQQVATSFEELRGLVTLGDTIYVTNTRGVTTKGTLAGLSALSLDLRLRRDASASPTGFAERDVNNIVVQRFDSLWNGPLIGLAAGAVPGLLIELAGRSEYEAFSGAGVLGLGGIGVVTGLLIDVLNREKRIVYVHRAGQQSSGVRVSPFLSKSVAGVQMSLEF